jgi:hypothetical protein
MMRLDRKRPQDKIIICLDRLTTIKKLSREPEFFLLLHGGDDVLKDNGISAKV